MTQTLQKIEKQPIDPQSVIDATIVNNLLDKAVDSKAAVDVIKELRAMRDEDNRRVSKAAFDAALSAFQSECPVIIKTKSVEGAYKYAPIEQIEQAIRPVERAHGFSHTFNQDVESQQGWVICICTVTHVAGHSQPTVSKFPLGTKTRLMSDTQQYAAALTFANRRTLANAYGLVIAGEDMDGKQPNARPIMAEPMVKPDDGLKKLASELWKILTPVRGDKKDWVQANQWMWREEILDGAVPEEAPNLSVKRFEEVILKAKEKLK